MRWIKIPEFKLVENNGNWNIFECINPGVAVYEKSGRKIILYFDIGWETDIATTPLWARSFLPQIGPHSPAALVHDKALSLKLSRAECREILWDQLVDLIDGEKISLFKSLVMYAGIWLYDECWRSIKLSVKAIFNLK